MACISPHAGTGMDTIAPFAPIKDDRKVEDHIRFGCPDLTGNRFTDKVRHIIDLL